MIEPAQNDRFSGAREAIEYGAEIFLYMRPIVPEWGSDRAKITYILLQAKEKIGNGISVIAPGGLRWTEGVEYGLTRRGIPWPESVLKVDNEKELSEELWQHIFSECARIFPDVPVVRNSSCGLSHILARPDIGAKHYLKPSVCEASRCTDVQRARCARQREILESPDAHEKAVRRVFASTGLKGLPPTDQREEVVRWLLGLPYDLKTTAIKTLADHGN